MDSVSRSFNVQSPSARYSQSNRGDQTSRTPRTPRYTSNARGDQSMTPRVVSYEASQEANGICRDVTHRVGVLVKFSLEAVKNLDGQRGQNHVVTPNKLAEACGKAVSAEEKKTTPRNRFVKSFRDQQTQQILIIVMRRDKEYEGNYYLEKMGLDRQLRNEEDSYSLITSFYVTEQEYQRRAVNENLPPIDQIGRVG
jgi:hypothetical protein